MKNRKIVVWGHHLHSHTHSYIHYAFYRAFENQGHETYWIDSAADIGGLDLSDSIFIVEGQVDGGVPLRKDCKYLLHNCDTKKYEESNVDFKMLQVYSHDVLDRDVEKIAECEYYQPSNRMLYQPWATDLLPHEFEKYPRVKIDSSRQPAINWVGSVMDGLHGNRPVLEEFASVAAMNGTIFKVCRNADPDEAINLVRNSIMAPALQGSWQVQNGYIPCRIFKNISYGHIGATNSEAVFNLYDGLITYNTNPTQLFVELKSQIDNPDNEKIQKALDLTREKHTYVNRIKNILKVMS